MAQKTKLDALQKYLTKKVNTTKQVQNQIKIVDYDLEGFDNKKSDDDDEEDVAFVETEESLKIDPELKKQILKSKLINTEQEKKPSNVGRWSTVVEDSEPQTLKRRASRSPESSDEEVVRRRHDTDSEDEDDNGPEEDREAREARLMREEAGRALGIKDNQVGNGLKQDEDEDIEVVRKSDKDLGAAGLTTAIELRLEREKNKKKEEMLNKLAEQFKNTETVYRNKEGKRVNIFKDIETKKRELQQKNEERIKQWSSGLVQKSEAERRREMLKHANEEFGKSEVSKEYDKELMEKKRFGDQMLSVMEKEEKKEKQNKAKFLLKCKFPAPFNRFGIEPGYMWDGVDRSNGYERRLMAKINEKRDQAETANVWAMREL